MDDKSHTKSFYEDVLVYRSFCFDPGEPIPLAADRRVAWVCKIIKGISSAQRPDYHFYFKQWDPRQHLEMCKTMWSFKFKQWDPGKICVVSNFHNLEDKVDFEGVSNVMILEAQIMSNPKVKGSGDSSTF
jgi:hypothetical protein